MSSRQNRLSSGSERVGLWVLFAALSSAACAGKGTPPPSACTTPKYVGTGTDTNIMDFEKVKNDESATYTNSDNLHVNFYSYSDTSDYGGDPWTWALQSPGQAGSFYLQWTYTTQCIANPIE